MRAEVLYEDEHVIVAYKPAGLATQTAKVNQADMASELKNYIKSSYIGVVHRLDQPVEGVLVFGKTKAATAALNKQLSQGILNKRYYAVLCGRQGADTAETGRYDTAEELRGTDRYDRNIYDGMEGTLTDYLRKAPDGRAEVVAVGSAAENIAGKFASGDEAKKAVLHYKILEIHVPEAEEPERVICLADISIETGRFHQIRAQMSHAGMPLLGDSKYGDECSRRASELLQARNVALCAYELCFIHPVTRKRMEFRIEPRAEIFQKFSGKLPK